MKYQIVYNLLTLNQLINNLDHIKYFIFNIIINKVDNLNYDLIGFCFILKSEEIIYLPFYNNYKNISNYINCIEALNILKPILENTLISKISYNIKISFKIFKYFNINLKGILFDVMLESYVFNSAIRCHNITSLELNYLDNVNKTIFPCKNKISIIDNKYNVLSCNNIDNIEHIALDAIKCTNVVFHVHRLLWPKIKKQIKLKKIFEEIEMPLISVISRIETIGVLISKKMLVYFLNQLIYDLDKLKLKIFLITQEDFNILSSKQLQKILYEKQKLPVLQKTSKGIPSTNEIVLNKLGLKFPLPKLILRYRSLVKFKSIINQLLKMMNNKSKRIHTSYHQAVVITGRLSSSSPNLQNIPIISNNGKYIRRAFIAPYDSLLVSADYSQIELRIMAHLSQDNELLKAFQENKDVHYITASKIFNLSLDKISIEQRRVAKIINFGLMYGMSAFGLSQQLDISYQEAQNFIEIYFSHYSGVLKYIKFIYSEINKNGYVSTIYGRRLYLSKMCSQKTNKHEKLKRLAINAPIQGTAADIIKKAMILIDNWIQTENIPANIVLQVHDELLFEVKNNAVDYFKIKVKQLMENSFFLKIPLKVNIGFGKNWEKAHH